MIYINNEAFSLDKAQPLSDVFRILNIEPAKGIAAALNNKVIPRSEWDKSIVNKNDKIILIKATQGG